MRGDKGANAGGGDWMRGEGNTRWKGGVSKHDRARTRYHAEIAQWRRRVFQRDGYTCRRCNLYPNTGRMLRAHHVAPWVSHPDKRFDVDNGITLCRDCHVWVHSNTNTEREYLV